MVAAEHGRLDVVEGLIRLFEVGKDIGINKKLNNGETAAALATAQGHCEIAQRINEAVARNFANPLAISKPAEATAVETMQRRDQNATPTKQEKLFNHLSEMIKEYSELFVETLPTAASLAEKEVARAEESQKVMHQRGLVVGEKMALYVICTWLHNNNFSTAANILSKDQSEIIRDPSHELSAAETQGLMQSITSKVLEVARPMIAANQTEAYFWLTEFARAKTTSALQAQNAVALLQDSSSNSAATTRGLFGDLNAAQAAVASSSTAEQFEL